MVARFSFRSLKITNLKFLGAKIVKDTKNITHIGFKVQDYPLISKMFEYRANIHIKIVQGVKVIGAEQMLVDAFIEAEISGFTFKNQKLSEVHRNLNYYTQFDDTIAKFIEMSDDPKLKKAQDLFRRIKLGRFYYVVWESSKFFDVNILNNQFGNHFILKHKQIPLEVPANIILLDDHVVVNPKRK